jgi:hypothetical protein
VIAYVEMLLLFVILFILVCRTRHSLVPRDCGTGGVGRFVSIVLRGHSRRR